MTDGYCGGYKKALIAISNLVSSVNSNNGFFKSKKKKIAAIESSLIELIVDKDLRNLFMEYGTLNEGMERLGYVFDKDTGCLRNEDDDA